MTLAYVILSNILGMLKKRDLGRAFFMRCKSVVFSQKQLLFYCNAVEKVDKSDDG